MASAAPSNGSCLCIFLADAVDMQHQIEKFLIITAPILLLLQESRNLFSTDICFRVIIGQHLYHAATPRFALSTAHQPLDEIADMHREPVVEAALRTAYALLAGEELKNPDIISVRGLNNSLVEATVPIPLKAQGGKIFELRVAVVNGALQDLKNVMKIINEDKDRWHFIEVMNCPGGCVNGGGQPLQGAGSSWLAPTTPLPVKL